MEEPDLQYSVVSPKKVQVCKVPQYLGLCIANAGPSTISEQPISTALKLNIPSVSEKCALPENSSRSQTPSGDTPKIHLSNSVLFVQGIIRTFSLLVSAASVAANGLLRLELTLLLR